MLPLGVRSVWRSVVLLSVLATGQPESACMSRRCLAKMLMDKSLMSQPQERSCNHTIFVPFMEYQTLSVVSTRVVPTPPAVGKLQDTKNLRLISRMQASLVWIDLDLAWDTADYEYDEMVLPVAKVWTPELHVTNG
ncbi:unnamed protein product [Tetraodon nigroviridis]|uniref:(spotted green pufferfish) hypothetical protein n=1 Tax=Tetraodon nigroviridis TaxID=99883 RepID=Q4TCC5_TETNG|nr:unnamed protein product [Tetraodon nigroviridis]